VNAHEAELKKHGKMHEFFAFFIGGSSGRIKDRLTSIDS
jgi:hypothetical protein